MEIIKKFEKTYHVHIYETGPDSKVTLASLFNYMQDIASDHAEILGFGRGDLGENNQIWVLSKMYGEFYDFPKWTDKVHLTTWPAGTEKMFFQRNYKLEYPDGRKIADVSSSWLIIDKTTKRIQRPTHLPIYNEVSFISEDFIREANRLDWDPSNLTTQQKFDIKIGDLDMNIHTNNVNYIKWIINSYDLNFITKFSPKSIEINYLAESMFGNEIELKSAKDDCMDSKHMHSVFDITNNKEVCRAEIVWKEKNDF